MNIHSKIKTTVSRVSSIFGAVFIISFLSFAFSLYAEDLSYDRYAPAKSSIQPSTGKGVAAHLLVYPFELIKWPVDQALIFTERYAIDKKIKWIYEQALDYGITPSEYIIGPFSWGSGVDLDFLRLTGQKQRFPNQTIKAWGIAISDVHHEVGTQIGWDQIGGTGLHANGIFKYEKRHNEHFYGIGPNSSRGDGTTYKMEVTTIEPSAGYQWNPALAADIKFAWRNINITNGMDGADIDPSFPGQVIPGLSGDQIASVGGKIKHDTRNHDQDSSEGGVESLEINFHEGINSDVRYFQYKTELSRYIKLGTERRVLALRFYGEHNNELPHHHVPFYDMAKLGGYGEFPRMSSALRGFDFNRFFGENAALFNVEYRYTIWEHRDWKVDTVLFWDEGQVFRKFGKFKFSDFRESYGGGFRLTVAHVNLLSVEAAHGDEGTNFYVKSSAPF
ncbi:MAG: BamA/TamA family outer membrane protein [Candidatus Omnitrophica bacterium]|nr:BamA/TamA family outer membrane protein [Candidatus Omnitrophota bacterium]